MPTVTYLKRNPPMAIEQGVTALYIKLTVGSTGAVTATSGYGLRSITRDATGEYTILLDRKYKKLLKYHATFIQATDQGLITSIKTDSMSSAGSLAIRTHVGVTETDPSSGTIILFEIVVADTGMSGGVA
jgi:hypothetical protein